MPIASGLTFWRLAPKPASTAGQRAAPAWALYSSCACRSRASAWSSVGLFANASATAASSSALPKRVHQSAGASSSASNRCAAPRTASPHDSLSGAAGARKSGPVAQPAAQPASAIAAIPFFSRLSIASSQSSVLR